MHPYMRSVKASKPRRLIVTAWGTPKTGKSHFALTFPEPIAYMNIDQSVEDILHKFPGLDLGLGTFEIPKKLDTAQCVELVRLFEEVLEANVQSLATTGGTIVLDTATWLWQIVQKVYLAPVRQKKARASQDPDEVRVLPFQYADANLFMSSLLRRVIPYENVNAVFLHSAQDAYNESGQPTGEQVCHGWKAVHGVSQFTIRLIYRDRQFWSRFEVCRLDTTLEGLELPNPTYDTFRELFLE